MQTISADGARIAARKTADVILLAAKRDENWSVRELPATGEITLMAFSPKADRLAYATKDRVSVLALD